MKKYLIGIIATIVFINGALAQGYEKSIEINGGPSLDKFSNYSFGISMNNGYRFNENVYAGVGLGFRYTDAKYFESYTSYKQFGTIHGDHYDSFDNKYLIPIFARIKANLGKSSVNPFLQIDLGTTIDVGKNPNKNTEGLFFEPTFGSDFKIADNSFVTFAVGYNLQKAHYTYYSTGYMEATGASQKEIKGMAGTLNFHIGFVF